MKIKTLGAFTTTANRVISKKAGEIINMPEEDYREVEKLCEIIEPKKGKKEKREEGEGEEEEGGGGKGGGGDHSRGGGNLLTKKKLDSRSRDPC